MGIRNPRPGYIFAAINMSSPIADTIWTAQPAAVTEFLGLTINRCFIDLTNFSQARLILRKSIIAGFGGAQLRGQFATIDGGVYDYLDGSTGPAVDIDVTNEI